MKIIQNIIRELSKDGFQEMVNFVTPQRESNSSKLLVLLWEKDDKAKEAEQK